MIIEERLLPGGVSVITPCDLVPSVSTALPMTIGELCDANEGLCSLIAARNAMMSTIYDIEEWES